MKRKVKGGMRVCAFNVFCRALNEGVEAGWNRAHKHTSKPSGDTIKECIETAVMNAVCEFFDFEEPAC